MMQDIDAEPVSTNYVSHTRTFIEQRYQKYLDDITPFTIGRWVGAGLLTLAFLARVFVLQNETERELNIKKSIFGGIFSFFFRLEDDSYRRIGNVDNIMGWYIVTYALGIYHLNLFIAFLTPKIDPAISLLEEDGGPELPTRANEEFRPFVRRLPEFKFWYSVTKSTLIAFFCTFFEFFNIPVFWPILVMYFITLFCLTMKKQIKHMIKYRYLPFTHGKPKYAGLNDTGKAEAVPLTTTIPEPQTPPE